MAIVQVPLYIDPATQKIYYIDATGAEVEVGGAGAAGNHAILSSTHTDSDSGDTPADRDVLTWDGVEWLAHQPDASRVVPIPLVRAQDASTPTINVNSTTYLQFSALRYGWDFDLAPMTHFRIIGRAQSSAAGQTITGQLSNTASPTTALSAGGDDFTVNNTISDVDTGWLAFAAAPTGFTLQGISLKGSVNTTDLLHTFLMVLLKNDP